MLPVDQLAKKIGRKVLFIGTECRNWTVADFGKAALNARALGFDSISPKRADGAIKWYVNAGHLALERQACLSVGVGYIPFSYCYGPAFGNGQINVEVAVAQEMANVCDGLVCMDLEVEWNGQVAAAQFLAQQLQGFKGDIVLSTWADPVQQNWVGVVKALNPVVSAWGPQEYTNWLALQEGQFASDGVSTAKLFPEIDVADLFGGANDPLSVMHSAVNRGHGSIWVWEYGIGLSNPNLVKSLTALIGPIAAPAVVPPKAVPPKAIVPPVKLPAPNHSTGQATSAYTIVDGDSLTAIATKLKITNWYQDLFVPNKTTLDATARVKGAADSNNGALIYAGTILHYLQSAVHA